MPKEIRIKAQHDCPFLEFSKFFGKDVYGYCSREFDLILVLGEITDEHIEMGHRLFPNFDAWEITSTGKDSKLSYLRFPCECEDYYRDTIGDSITSQVQKAGGMLNYPIIYKDGWEYHKITCITDHDVSNVLKVIEKLPELEILSIHDLGDHGLFKSMMVSVQDLIGNITERQADVLISAYQNGYYDIPRRIRTQDIANELGISRYGVEKVLRSAENKVIRALIPYLYLKSDVSTTKIKTEKVY